MTIPPIPILLCGKIPGHITAVTEVVKPEAQIIKACSTAEDAKAMITALMSSATIDGVKYPKPKAIIMGGGFSNDDFQSIYDSVDGAKSVAWIRPGGFKPGNSLPPKPPSAEFVATSVRKVLDAHLVDLKDGRGAGDTWFMTDY